MWLCVLVLNDEKTVGVYLIGEMNEATRKSTPVQETTNSTSRVSPAPSVTDSGMELGLNSWFPAYGYHAPQLQLQIHAATHYQPNFQPTHEDTRSNDALLVQQVEFLETILEETSDDLQSDSDRSGTAYWLGSDSETESVIHVRARHAEEKLDGSGSECNSVVPKKRRRKNGVEEDEDAAMMYGDNEEEDEDEEDEDFSSSSQSSSLIQFETLERNCATTCRDSPSSYSFDSLDFSNRRTNQNFGNTSPDSLEGRSLTETENVMMTNGSSSLGRERMTNGIGKILRPYRSFESLDTCQRLEEQSQPNGGFLIYPRTANNTRNHNSSSRGIDDDYSDYDEYDDRDIDVGRISPRRLSTRDRDFWHQDDEYDDGIDELKNFEDRLSFGEVTSNYSKSLDCRNIIDLREIGIETKRDAVLDLRSGQTVTSASALLQSRINIAGIMGRSGGGGGGGSCGGQQGWSEQGFNFRFTDKSQSVPSLATDVSKLGVLGGTRRCSISPSQLHFEAQDFENFVQVSSVPVGLNLCGLASHNAFRARSDSYDNKMADSSEPEVSPSPSPSPDAIQEDREQKKQQITSTVRTQDRTETNLVLVPVPMTDHDVDSLVDEAIRQFKREVEEAGGQNPEEGSSTSHNKKQTQHPRKIKNNASYELAQQFEVDQFTRRMPSFDELEDETPKPTPRRRVRNNASYELAQQFDYVKAVAGQRPFQRMDACDELEEPGTSGLKVTDLVEEMTMKSTGTGSAMNLTTPNGFGPHEHRVYSKSSENISEKERSVANETHPQSQGKLDKKKRSTIPESESVFGQIKKNLDSFSTYGESANEEYIDDIEDPNLFENKSLLIDHHHHHHHHHHNKNNNQYHEESTPSKIPLAEEERSLSSEGNENTEKCKPKSLKVNVNCGGSNMFAVKTTSLDSSSSRSASSTPNLHKMSFIGEFYPEQNTSYVQSSRDISGTENDPFIDDVDEGIGSVKDYDRLFLHGSVRSESAIGMKSSRDSRALDRHIEPEDEISTPCHSSRNLNDHRRSRAGSSTTSGNTSLGEGSTASEWPQQRPEADNVYPPLSTTRVEPLQRITTSLKRSGTVEAKQTQSKTLVSSSSSSLLGDNKMSSKFSSSDTVPNVQDTTGMIVGTQGSGKINTEKKKGLGGFLQRFSRLRFSGRSKVPRSELLKKSDSRPNNVNVINKSVHAKNNKEPDYVIIPLHGPVDDARRDHHHHLAVVEPSGQDHSGKSSNDVQRSGSNLSSNSRSGISSKPPLPPQPPRAGALSARPPSGVGTRRRAATDLGSPTAIEMAKARAMQAGSERPVGLLETDLDAADVADASVDHQQVGVATPANSNKKTRSLLNLNHSRAVPGGRNVLNATQSPGGTNVEGASACGHQRPHKSMEYLLDKENLHSVKPPENELQKVGERVPSEHELRVQRSLQRLNVPDWYKNSPAARDGFRLKRHSDASQHGGWRTLGSKTTSLSSLSSSNKPPTGGPLLSPSPTPPVFSRWSTSLLNSAGSSPASSARSSFNHRQPYLGWRSQERLSNPRTPAERLAQGILPNVPPTSKKQPTSFGPAQQLEVRNSIKEVTSAIVHYVQSGQEVNGGRLSPRPDDWEDRGGARSTSPRGSVKLCWMESSFVGIRPVDSPKTPMSLTTDMECCAVCNSTQNEPCTCVDSAASGLFLDLTPDGAQRTSPSSSSHHHHHHHHRHHRGSGSGNSDTEEAMAAAALLRNKPSPGSTTLEDVLDSLLGLPPASRTPSPGPGPTRRSTAAGKSCSTLRQDLQESASTMVETSLQELGETTTASSYYIQGGHIRRKSEGSDSLPPRNTSKSCSLRNRRVSFDNAQDSPGNQQHQQQQQLQQQERMMVRCRYSKCTSSATASEARRSFKTCHNCSYAYCSRECRRAHWERHRRTCLHSRAGTLCRQVLSSAKKDGHSLQHISTLAKRGHSSHGRGAVKCFFTSPESAEKFITNGFIALGEPTYVRWSDLLPSEMGTELHAELMRLCKSYNPETRLVLYVAVCVVSEVPTTGAVRWERQLVSRCAKIRLAGTLREPGTILVATSGNGQQQQQQPQRQTSPCNITREMDSPETLVLTSLPGTNGQNTPQRAREISFTNIQRQLRLRGVSLRRHFPQVYKKLCSYVDGSVDKFAPVTIYPRDQASGKSFMCIIMLDAEPERLQLLPTDSSRVRTVDISIEQE